MHTYIVCYTLHNPGGQHPEHPSGQVNYVGKTDDTIKRLDENALYMGPALVNGGGVERRVWVVKTDKDKSAVKDRLRQVLSSEDVCVVGEVEMSDEEWDKLKGNEPKKS